ncbi:hypothetical protein J11TS1_04120 [Oceanobacillus sp. J11TS1]|nr:hypothetical protein J11TS1_04120 [Oceanobacillus sp. J11TS1]
MKYHVMYLAPSARFALLVTDFVILHVYVILALLYSFLDEVSIFHNSLSKKYHGSAAVSIDLLIAYTAGVGPLAW